MGNLNKAIQYVTKKQMEGASLCNYSIGTVVSSDPLEIKINDRITLPSSMILLSETVIEKKLDITHEHHISANTQTSDLHTHGIDVNTEKSTDTAIVIQEGLSDGDKVIMISVESGQCFIVISKLRTKTKVTIDKSGSWDWN